MFEFSVSKDMKKNTINNDKTRIPIYLPGYLLIPIVEELKVIVDQDRVLTTLNIIKY